MKFVQLCFYLAIVVQTSSSQTCQQGVNCKLPNCFCSTFSHRENPKDYPQIVYFGFDDALTSPMALHYRRLFSPDRKNPNNCPIGMSLYIQDNYTDYSIVREMYLKGMEIGVHSVTHHNIDTKAKLINEGRQQRLNLHQMGGVPLEEIVGWRSPNLKTAGDDQPSVLQDLGYLYDISLTYTRRAYGERKAFPYTFDYGNPLPCMIEPCPTSSHPGFWEIPINSLLDYKNEYPCPYVDGCYNGPRSETESFEYLYKNFMDYYKNGKEPFGFHMHAAWFETSYNLRAMDKLIRHILTLPDVYIVTARQMLDWIRNPVHISELHTIPSWTCSSHSKYTLPPLKIEFPSNEVVKPINSLASKNRPFTKKPLNVMTERPPKFTTPKYTYTRKPSTPPPPTAARWAPTTAKWVYWLQPTEPPYRNPFAPLKAAVSSDVSHRKTGSGNYIYKVNRQALTSRYTTPRYTTPNYVTKTTVRPRRIYKMTESPKRKPVRNRNPFAPLVKGGHPTGSQRTTINRRPKIKPVKPDSDQCHQGANCHLPDCYCRSTQKPIGLGYNDLPQLVYFAFDGPVDGRVYAAYLSMFNTSRRNPDGCPITATLFVAKDGNYVSYLQNLASRGFDIALRGGHHGAYNDWRAMQTDLDHELNILGRQMQNTSFYGWRSPGARPLSDEQFNLISSRRLKYDSSLIVRTDIGTAGMPYPYTLDYGWKEPCYTNSGCPRKRYPGFWEVPIYTLRDYLGQFRCIYADGCMHNPDSEQDTFNFLVHNFKRHYNTNKAPFGVNLRHLWFSHYLYKPNKAGLHRFIQYLVDLPDVYIVNINQLVDWMKNPTPLSQLQRYQPWICQPYYW